MFTPKYNRTEPLKSNPEVIIDPTELIELADDLEAVPNSVVMNGKVYCGRGNYISQRLRKIVYLSRPF